MTRTGGCECGAARFQITGDDPVHVYVCHCLNCQIRSGSAFAEHAMLPSTRFRIEGETTCYERQANGIRFTEVFCATCHTRLFNHNDMLSDMIFLRVGTLASRDSAPIAHIWTSRKQHWVTLPPDVPAFPESPTPEEFGGVLQNAGQS